MLQPLLLEGHHKTVEACGFSRLGTQTLLCSCSPDYAIVWNITVLNKREDENIRGKVAYSAPGCVQHVTFSPHDNKMAISAGCDVLIVNSQVILYCQFVSFGIIFRKNNYLYISKHMQKK